MRKHLALTCAAYFFIGCGMSVEQLGIKAGMGLGFCITFFICSMVFFVVIVFTSMQKVKDKLGIGAPQSETTQTPHP